MRRMIAICIALGLSGGAAHADLSIPTFNTPVVVDFQDYEGTGFSPGSVSGDLDSNHWRLEGMSDGDTTFGGTFSGGDFGRGTSEGGVTTGGAYAFDVSNDSSGNWAFGVQAAGSDVTPGFITLRLQNNTGTTISQLDVAFEIFEFNDQDRGNTFNFAHSADDSLYTVETDLNFTSTELGDASPAWVQHDRNISLTGLSIADGSFYYLQWQTDDDTGGGSRDELALNNVSIIAVPEPATMVLFGAAMAGLLCTRRFRPRG